jgi:hypothetical protein
MSPLRLAAAALRKGKKYYRDIFGLSFHILRKCVAFIALSLEAESLTAPRPRRPELRLAETA